MSSAGNKGALRSALGRARGLGSAKSGVQHWIHQRLTALVLIPLMLCLVSTIVHLPSLEHAAAAAYVSQPLVALTLFFTVVAMFWHAKLGLTVVIEDYVHTPILRISLLVFVKVAAVTAVASVALALAKLVIAA